MKQFNDATLFVLQKQVQNLTDICRMQMKQNEELLRQNEELLKQVAEMNELLQEVSGDQLGAIKAAIEKGELVEIGRLTLPSRMRIRLKHTAGVIYVNDLVQYTRSELLQRPRIGEKGVAEIERELRRHGLSLAKKTKKPRSTRKA